MTPEEGSSRSGDGSRAKDRWDKFAVLTQFIASVVIVAIGGTFTCFYAERQQLLLEHDAKTRELDAIAKFIPFLTNRNEEQKTAAFITLKTFASERTVTQLALINGTSGAIRVISDIAQASQDPNSRKFAENAVDAITGPRERSIDAQIAGRWLLRPENQPPGVVVTWMNIESHGKQLQVIGESWSGQGSFDGHDGFYDWKFSDGRTGRTKIHLDATGILYGKALGSGIDWTYWATRPKE